jgi:hypothetical protein
MPAQNRVTPFGEIVAYPERGKFLGNRGELKVKGGQLVGAARWKTQSWIYCDTDPKYAQKEGEPPHRYTNLFFLDEPTALSAGHRPCGYCLRKRYAQFVACWLKGNPQFNFEKDVPKQIDRVLHQERTSRMNGEETLRGTLAELPPAVMIIRPEESQHCYLWYDDHLRRWTPAGYSEKLSVDPDTIVEVLTPASIVNAIRAGFIPEVEV